MRPAVLLRSSFVLLASIAFVATAGTALADVNDPGGNFIDDDGAFYESSVEAIFAEGITVGCSNRQQFCPERGITRGEMAAFLRRSLNLPYTEVDYFVDDETSIFEADINAIAEAGITKGCNPPNNERFCVDRVLRRGEMAAFLVRAFGLQAALNVDRFEDDDESIFEADIDALAEAGITTGCNPPENTLYCPNDVVTRGVMAVFLTRALDLTPLQPPPRPPVHLVSRFTTYHDCCEPRVTNIHIMANELDGLMILPWETFNLNQWIGPRTTSKGYVAAPILLNGGGYCCDHPLNIGGGTSQNGTTLYNAIFWGAYDEISHSPHGLYISRYPLGIEATLGYPSPNIIFRNDTWTPIYINAYYTGTSITFELWGNNGGRTVVGSHRYGKTTVTVTKSGDATARRVTATVTGSATYDDGGNVTVKRTITGPGGTTTETWHVVYQEPATQS